MNIFAWIAFAWLGTAFFAKPGLDFAVSIICTTICATGAGIISEIRRGRGSE